MQPSPRCEKPDGSPIPSKQQRSWGNLVSDTTSRFTLGDVACSRISSDLTSSWTPRLIRGLIKAVRARPALLKLLFGKSGNSSKDKRLTLRRLIGEVTIELAPLAKQESGVDWVEELVEQGLLKVKVPKGTPVLTKRWMSGRIPHETVIGKLKRSVNSLLDVEVNDEVPLFDSNSFQRTLDHGEAAGIKA